MALGAFHFFIAEDKGFEMMITFPAGVFKERHCGLRGAD
jgi:hypothetical protein